MQMTDCSIKALDQPLLRIRLLPWPLRSASRRALCCRLLVSEGMAAVRTQQGRLGKLGNLILGELIRGGLNFFFYKWQVELIIRVCKYRAV